MATQARMFENTIVGMKKALKRKAYDSDSDSSIDKLTNRGHKLRKNAKHVHQGQLGLPSGPQVYKRRVEHAGYQREIISRNPALIDEDGYEVDSDDDDERAQQAAVSAAEMDPYADIRLEQLLVPLTAASELPLHPTLSRPFTSDTLTRLTKDAGEMVQKENKALWKIKHLLTKLSGHDNWIPCESVETSRDIALFVDEPERRRGRAKLVSNEEDAGSGSPGTIGSDDGSTAPASRMNTEKDVYMNGTWQSAVIVDRAAADDMPGSSISTTGPSNGQSGQSEHSKKSGVVSLPNGINSVPFQHGTISPPEPDPQAVEGVLKILSRIEATPIARSPLPESRNANPGIPAATVDVGEDVEMETLDEGQEDVPAPRRMRTRAQAQAASDDNHTHRTRSTTSENTNSSGIHPYFLVPQSSIPDRDLGLPYSEAEEVRRLLQLYIQKQEEVCRGAQKVYDGLLRSNRYRRLVMNWAKSEAHVGVNRDMSDGEDWYDKEEWGLDEDLKKGEDEQEEDAATTAKKTRTRRQ